MSKCKVSKSEVDQSSGLSMLEGRVLQWLDRLHHKQLLIATSQGEVVIKLHKALRHHLATLLDRQLLGVWVQISGSYRKNGEYKAESIRFYDLPSNSFHRAGDSTSSSSQPNLTEIPPSRPVVAPKPACILVCGKSSCQRRGAGAVIASLQETIRDRHLTPQVKVKVTGCLKKCKQGVNLVILPDKTAYTQVKPIQVSSLVTKHFPPPAIESLKDSLPILLQKN